MTSNINPMMSNVNPDGTAIILFARFRPNIKDDDKLIEYLTICPDARLS